MMKGILRIGGGSFCGPADDGDCGRLQPAAGTLPTKLSCDHGAGTFSLGGRISRSQLGSSSSRNLTHHRRRDRDSDAIARAAASGGNRDFKLNSRAAARQVESAGLGV